LKTEFWSMLFGKATLPIMITFAIITTLWSKAYRDWRIYKAIMGSKAKTYDDPLFPRKKKPEPPTDSPPEEEPKN